MFQKFDIVEFPQGDQMIVTEIKPSRPANPYVGVKMNGQGAPYKFGPKHMPKKVGTAPANHPALQANAARGNNKSGALTPGARETLAQMLTAVESGDLAQAQALVPAVRVLI